MGIDPSADVFQVVMTELFRHFKDILIYIDNLLVVTRGTYKDHLTVLRKVLKNIQEEGLKIHLKKCYFAQQTLPYMVFFIDCEGIRPDPFKVSALRNIAPPKTLR